MDRKFCPFRSTPDVTMYCSENCALRLPCEDEEDGNICSIKLTAMAVSGYNEEDEQD